MITCELYLLIQKSWWSWTTLVTRLSARKKIESNISVSVSAEHVMALLVSLTSIQNKTVHVVTVTAAKQAIVYTYEWLKGLSHDMRNNDKMSTNIRFQGLAMLWHKDWTLWDSRWWRDALTSHRMEPRCSNPFLQVIFTSCSWTSQTTKVSRVASTTSGSSFQAKVHTA